MAAVRPSACRRTFVSPARSTFPKTFCRTAATRLLKSASFSNAGPLSARHEHGQLLDQGQCAARAVVATEGSNVRSRDLGDYGGGVAVWRRKETLGGATRCSCGRISAAGRDSALGFSSSKSLRAVARRY